MADKPKPKRRLRPAQTVRERATQEPNKKTKRFSKVRRALSWPFRKLAKAIFRIGKFLGKYRIFRIIGKIFKFIAKILLISYVAGSWRELKLVEWPSRKESRRLTFAVLAFSIVFGALVASLDYGLGHLFKIILLGKK